MSDVKLLTDALNDVGATPNQVKTAAMLMTINGLGCALVFVYGLQKRGLTRVPYQPPLFGHRSEIVNEYEIKTEWDGDPPADLEQMEIVFEYGQWWVVGYDVDDQRRTFAVKETNRGLDFEEV